MARPIQGRRVDVLCEAGRAGGERIKYDSPASPARTTKRYTHLPAVFAVGINARKDVPEHDPPVAVAA